MKSLLAVVFAIGVCAPPTWGEPQGKIVVAVSTLQEETPDPHRYTGSLLRPLLHHIGEGLTQRNLEGKLVGGLAESWTLRPDGMAWDFTLRPGVKFHDGNVMTAEDVKWSVERMLRPEIKNALAPNLGPVLDRIEVVDDHHLRFHTKKPDPYLILQAAYDLRIGSKKYHDAVGDEKFSKQPVAAGPFKFVKQAIGQYAELEGFQDFYDPERVPRVKDVVLKVVPEVSTRLAMLKTGEADVIDGVSGPMVQEIKGTAGLHTASSPEAALMAINFCDFVHPEPSPTKDKRVRQALAYAIDRQAIIKKIFFGNASIQVVAGHGSISFGFDPTLKPYPYDPDKAKALLAEAGYANGFETEILSYVSSSTPLIPEVMEAVAGFWGKIGVKAKITRMESGQYFGMWREKKLRGTAPISYFPPLDAGLNDQTMFKTAGGYSYYSNPVVDELVEKQATEMDVKKREEILKTICRHVHEELPRIPLIHADTIFGLGQRVKEWKLQKGMLPFCVGLERIVLK